MADSDKNILITPNRGQTNEPKIEFVGSSSLPITLKVLDDNSLSWEGSEGQLFSITNNLSTGTIFSVNDISGVPSIEVNADGTVILAEFSGNVGVGTASPTHKLTVSGTLSASVGIFDSITGSLAGTATTALTASNVNILDTTDDNSNFKVVFASDFEGSLRVRGDEDGFNYNPFTNTLSNVTLNGTATQVSQTLTRGSYLTGNNYNGSAATTWAVDATSANTASKVVARDGSGNFSAGIITTTAVRSGNGTVADPAFAPSSDTNTGIFFPATHTIAFTEGGVERVRIDSNGDVGIGTTDPLDKLHVNGPIRVTGIGSGTALRVEGGSNDPVLIRASNTTNNDSGSYGFSIKYMGSRSSNNNSLSIFSDNQAAATQIEAFTILQDGKIGIGTISPSSLLDVAGDLRVNTDTLFVDSTNNRVGIGTASPAHSLHIGGTFRTYFATGTATEGSLTLDDRLIVSSSMDQNTIFNMNTPYTDLGAMEVFTLKLRSTSVASIADEFGPAITFKVQDNNNSENLIGVISAVKTNSANNTGDLVFGTTQTGSPYERMRLDSNSGLTIGLGTTDSSGALLVKKHKNTSIPSISIATGSVVNGFFNCDVTDTVLASVGRNLTLGAWTNLATPPSNSITITSEGRMGIGETSPAAPLTVDGDNVTKYAAILNDNKADGVVQIKGSTDDYLFVTNASSDKVGIGLLPESYKFQVTGSNASAGTICAGFGDGIQVGNTYIGRWATNSSYAGIYHTNQRTNGSSYSLIAASDGQTFINSAALKSLYFRINNNDAMIINSDRNVGIGTTSPTQKLHLVDSQSTGFVSYIQNEATSGHGIRIYAGDYISSTQQILIQFRTSPSSVNVSGGTYVGQIFYNNSNTLIYSTFTGGHEAETLSSEQESIPLGSIIKVVNSSVSGSYSFNQPLYDCELTKTEKEKGVIGVYGGITGENNDKSSILSLGDGQVLVCSDGGDIEIGDYICSSNREGIGMKQDDDLLHNYTVAKATQSVIWSQETTDVKIINCTYHCG